VGLDGFVLCCVCVTSLHVEYAERRIEYCILFIFSLLYEYFNLECVHIHLMYRVEQAEYVFHIRVVAPQEYVNIYSTRRVTSVLLNRRNKRRAWGSRRRRTCSSTQGRRQTSVGGVVVWCVCDQPTC